MIIITDLSQIRPSDTGSVLAIGNFDGVHIGHQAIISYAKALAEKNNLPLVVLTFDPFSLSMRYDAVASPGTVELVAIRISLITPLLALASSS